MSALSEKLRAAPLRREVLENCPQLGRVAVRQLPAKDFIALHDSLRDQDTVGKMQTWVIASVIDADTGEQVFAESDRDILLDYHMLAAISAMAVDVNGLKATPEDAEKN